MEIIIRLTGGARREISLRHQDITGGKIAQILYQDFKMLQAHDRDRQLILSFARNILTYFPDRQIYEAGITLRKRYTRNHDMATGKKIRCPTCNVPILKVRTDTMFCSSQGRKNCKNIFWNTIKVYPIYRVIDGQEYFFPADESEQLTHLPEGVQHGTNAVSVISHQPDDLSE